MTNLILQYYEGILKQLRSEVDSINSAFKHQGMKGSGNEAVLRNLLEKFLPKKYGVGTGIVIDNEGNQSRQCDIVIYDNVLYPSLLALGNVHLFPVDIVYATIEVKTTLDTKSSREAQENIRSVRTLKLVPDTFAAPTARSGSKPDDVIWSLEIAAPTPPLGFVFAYNSSTPRLETFTAWFLPNQLTQIVGVPQFPLLSSPSLVGCLDQGLLVYTNAENAATPQPSSDFELRAWALNVWEDDHPLQVPEAETEFVHAGHSYPIKHAGSMSYAVDQSHVLLAFLLMMQEFLARKLMNPSIMFIDSYLGQTPLLKRTIYLPMRDTSRQEDPPA